jgi:hypothetical protein
MVSTLNRVQRAFGAGPPVVPRKPCGAPTSERIRTAIASLRPHFEEQGFIL